jgi:hypothetical protein
VTLKLQAKLIFGLLLTFSVDGSAAPLPGVRPVDIELDRLGALAGEVHQGDHVLGGKPRVQVYSGRRLVAASPVTANGEFRIEGLDGGLYWVTAASGTSRLVRAWDLGTAPPLAHPWLVLAPARTSIPSGHSEPIVRGQTPLVTSPADPGWVAQPTTAYPYQPTAAYPYQPTAAYPYQPTAAYPYQPTAAYPFQPYQVPGGGMMFPGTYTSPGAVFANPLVTVSVLTGMAGVILVATDDDDDDESAPGAVVPPASP